MQFSEYEKRHGQPTWFGFCRDVLLLGRTLLDPPDTVAVHELSRTPLKCVNISNNHGHRQGILVPYLDVP